MRILLSALAAIIVFLFLLTGCGSKKNVASGSSSQPPAIPSATASKIIREAELWIGTPYRYGAQTRRKGTDCSGMTMVIYRDKAGVSLPRNSAEQQRFCMPVSKENLQPGDLVFFSSSTRGGRVNHVGIYRGDGEFIHASSSRGVMVSRLDQKYFATHYHSAGRVRELATAAPSRPNQPLVSPVPDLSHNEPVRPPQNYIEIVFNTDSIIQDTTSRDTTPNHYEQLWQRAEAELDSIITASIDSLVAE